MLLSEEAIEPSDRVEEEGEAVIEIPVGDRGQCAAGGLGLALEVEVDILQLDARPAVSNDALRAPITLLEPQHCW